MSSLQLLRQVLLLHRLLFTGYLVIAPNVDEVLFAQHALVLVLQELRVSVDGLWGLSLSSFPIFRRFVSLHSLLLHQRETLHDCRWHGHLRGDRDFLGGLRREASQLGYVERLNCLTTLAPMQLR